MRIIISGGRDFDDYDLLCEKVDRFILMSHEKISDILIVSGKAKGADLLGEKYALENNIECKTFIPKWDELGKSAGYIRNYEMIKYAKEDKGVLIVFWDKKSKETKHCIDNAIKEKLTVIVYNYGE